jgi:acetyl-CoA synthetase
MTVVPSQGPPRTIHKRAPGGVAANMPDYDQARAEFSWAVARAELAGLPAGGLNIAYEAVDRHADGPLADIAALRFLSKRRAASERRDRRN